MANVRTLAEIHADRAVVRVTVDHHSDTDQVNESLRRKLADVERELVRRTWERGDRERARAAQEARVQELEQSLLINMAQKDALEARVQGLIGELAGAERRVRDLGEKVRLYDQDRHTERDRADQNREWAERAELRAAKTTELLDEAKQALRKISMEVAAQESCGQLVAFPDDVLDNVRDLVSPWADEGTTPTSQA